MKYSLDFEPEVDFDLVAICTHLKDYKLCWLINNSLEMNLSRRANDLKMEHGTQAAATYHPEYTYYNDLTHTAYHLIKNKTNGLFIPEQRQVDYFLLIRENVNIDVNRLVSTLRNIDHVLTAFRIDPESLRCRERLIYLDFETN